MDDAPRLYSRAAAVAFVLVAVYTVALKAPSGELSDDWAHTVLHVATGIVAAFAGWGARSALPARAFAAAIAVGYGALGVGGWFIDGLLLEREARIPLGVGDNVFHLLLAVGAVVAVASVLRGRRSAG